MKVGGVGTELADWVGITVRRDADHMHVGMNVDSGRVRIDDIEPAAEAGTGTGNDRSLDLPGLAGFFGSWFGTTMDVSGWTIRIV